MENCGLQDLINDSVNVLYDETLDTVYNWLDYGDVLNNKLRNGIALDEFESELVFNVNELLSAVKSKHDMVVYRGIQGAFVNNVKQYNSVTPDMQTALTYGDTVMKILIPKGTSMFYMSAWELVVPECENNVEKEILLPPGLFISLGMSTYRFVEL